MNKMRKMKRRNRLFIGSLLLLITGAGCADAQQDPQGLHTFHIQSPEELRDFLSYGEDNIPLVNTHRGGAAAGFPENAIETFENTLRHTWSMMEVDPRYSKDSTIVLFHDGTLDRTSTGTGRVQDYTYDELQELRLTDVNGDVTDFRIPELGEALDWARGKTILFLDNKDVPAEIRAEFVQQHQAQAFAVVMVYSLEDARKVYAVDPDIMMQVFMADEAAVERFDQSGLPWENVVGFVTHRWPEDGNIFRLINQKGALAVVGTSRTVDREYMRGEITEQELGARYRELIELGADILEPDLGIETGRALEQMFTEQSPKRRYFKN